MNYAQETIRTLSGQRVLVVGDIMLDRYFTGQVTRISPEAPVPIFLHESTQDRLGGAANVALNIAALGSEPILCGLVGADADGDALLQLLPDCGIQDTGIVRSASRKTTSKTRILGNHQQMLRLDREDTHPLTSNEEQEFIEKILALLELPGLRSVIFQDYNKGVLTPLIIKTLIKACKEKHLITTVDPKKANFFHYQGVSLFKPNLKEIRDSAPFSVQTSTESLKQADDFLRSQLQHEKTMITLSEKGLFMSEKAGAGAVFPTIARNIADVSGAGDTVISIATLGLAADLPVETIAALSNLAGGQVCEFSGVVPVNTHILAQEYEAFIKNSPE
jgi:rfaE bifunctional protein kinase chain/domain